MHRHLSRLAYLVPAVVTLGLMVGVPPAVAGGPTSVLIVEPETGRTAAAYYDDPAYAALDAMLGSGPAGPRQAADGSFGDRGTGRSITVTWLIHDMAVWRVNRVFPDAPGGPWVLTYAWDDNGTMPQLGTWSRPDSPKKLVAALDLALDTAAGVGGSAAEPSTVVETVTAAGHRRARGRPRRPTAADDRPGRPRSLPRRPGRRSWSPARRPEPPSCSWRGLLSDWSGAAGHRDRRISRSAST